MFSQTYILYDDAGIVKLNYISELKGYANIFSQFTIFSEKNNQKFKYFTKNNKKKFLQPKKELQW